VKKKTPFRLTPYQVQWLVDRRLRHRRFTRSICAILAIELSTVALGMRCGLADPCSGKDPDIPRKLILFRHSVFGGRRQALVIADAFHVNPAVYRFCSPAG